MAAAPRRAGLIGTSSPDYCRKVETPFVYRPPPLLANRAPGRFVGPGGADVQLDKPVLVACPGLVGTVAGMRARSFLVPVFAVLASVVSVAPATADSGTDQVLPVAELVTRSPLGLESAGTVLEVAVGADLSEVAVAAAAAAGLDVDEITVITELDAIALPVTDVALVDELAQLPGVTTVAPDPVAYALTPVTPNDPFLEFQWGLNTAKVPQGWARTTGSPDVVVAVVDTGVRAVSELAGALLPGYDFVDDDNDADDDNGHGTASATVIAARGDNNDGMAGLCWSCRILPVRVLGTDGSGTYSAVAQGIVWAADQGADIINLSLGGTASSSLLDAAVAYARDAGSVVIASAGNNGLVQPFYPASSPGAISVAGHTETLARYSWSNYGTELVDVSAPGCNVAQFEDGFHYWYCGTSSAAPFVSGLAALALSAQEGLTPTALETALFDTATPDGFTRHGIVDAERLLFEHPYVDPVAPSVTFVSPLPGRTVTGTITAIAAPVDNASVARVDLWAGDVLVGTASSAPWSVSFESGAFASGPVTLKWRVFDRAGNVGVVERSISLDNAAPTVAFAAPSPSQAVRGSVAVTASPTDDVAVARVDLYHGTTRLGSAFAAPWVVSFNSDTLPEGTTTLRLRAHDRVGNVAVVSRQVVIDRTPPTAAVAWPNPGRVVRGTIGVQTSLGDNVGIAQTSLLVNGVVVSTHPGAPLVISWDTTGTLGRTELQLLATDHAGNRTWSPVRVVTVDNVAPTVTLTSPRPGAEVAGSVTIEGQAGDNVGIARVELWVGAQMLSTTTSTTFSFTLGTTPFIGPLAFRVVAVDLAGNRLPFTRTVVASGS